MLGKFFKGLDMDKTYLMIGAVFVANLLISLILRASLKRDRTIRDMNKNYKQFVMESQMSIKKLEESYKNYEERLASVIEDTKTAIANIDESLDKLFFHQKELSQLDDVCKNYKIALEKLKIQTEHAESRIHAVQAEVKKAESVDSFVKQFQLDAERVVNQMQDLKAEHARLVASTEQSLKVASQNQMDENNQMLTAFGVSLERFKTQFAEFIASEKVQFSDLCRKQEELACNNLNVLSDKSLDIHQAIDQATGNLLSLREELESVTTELESRKDASIASLAEASEAYNLSIKEYGDSQEELLKQRLSDKERDISSLVEEFSVKVQKEDERFNEALLGLERMREQIVLSISEAEARYAEELRNSSQECSDQLSERISNKESDVKAALEEFSLEIDEKKAQIKASLDSLDKRRDESIDEFSRRMQEEALKVEDAIAKLVENKAISIKEFTDRMIEEENKVSLALSGLAEERDKAIAAFSDRMAERENDVELSLKNMSEQKSAMVGDFSQAVDNKRKELELAMEALDSEREAYIDKCRTALDENFQEVIAESESHLDRMRATGEEMMKYLADRISSSKQAVILLNETSKEKINESIDTLREVERNIAAKKDSFNSLQEEITSKKEIVWKLDQQIKGTQNRIEAFKEDPSSLSADMAQEEEISESLESEEVLKSSKKRKRKPQDMIEAFPDDIYIGAEEKINLDD